MEAGAPAPAIELLASSRDPRAALLETRARYEAGDLAGAVRRAGAALPGADEGQRRELLWWGCKAALALGDADAAEAWTRALVVAAAAEPSWSETVGRFVAETERLAERDRRSESALARARSLVLLGLALLLGLGLWAALRAPADGRARAANERT